jgi:hypothetical protein
MPDFEQLWSNINRPRDGEPVSPALKPLLHQAYDAISLQPRDLPAIKHALQNLLQYLAAAGRTNANCWATDLFFMNSQDWEAHWAEAALPAPLHDILAKISEALHDTVRNPEIAKNFACLPEQLLAELNRISTE